MPASASPVAVALVLAACSTSYITLTSGIAAVLCLLVALIGQMACNVINDLEDYKQGSDTEARIGFERPLSTGKANYSSVKRLAYALLAVTAAVGIAIVVLLANWYLLLLGILVLLGSYAYSGGPYPMSRHGLGEVMVFVFYGLVAFLGTYYVACHTITIEAFCLACSVGLANVNILLVNNYRDAEEDAKSGKRTLAVRFGAPLMPLLYGININLAVFLVIPFYRWIAFVLLIPYYLMATTQLKQMKQYEGSPKLNQVLARTAIGVSVLSLCTIASILLHHYLY